MKHALIKSLIKLYIYMAITHIMIQIFYRKAYITIVRNLFSYYIINDNIKINIFHGKVNTLYSIDYYFNYTQFHVFINLFL